MAAPGYHYSNGLFNEDHLPPTGSSPPPPYHIVVADRPHRASASHPQGQSSPILTTFQTLPRGAPAQGHATSVSPTSAYAVLASEMAGAQGQVYHQFVQVPYPGTRYPPGVPPGFPPSPSSPLSPAAARSPHQASAHLVPQQLPTHTGRDPGSAVPSSIQPTPPVSAQQPISAPTSTSTFTSTLTATATNCTDTWTPEQDRFIFRLGNHKRKSHQKISIALEDVFQVKRDVGAIARRLAQLRARSKVWSEDELKQAAQKAMQSFSSVMQEELASSFELHFTADPNRDRNSLNDADNKQSADLRLAVRLELEGMLAQGNLTRTTQERMVSEQKERSARCTIAMGQRERGREREWEWVDGDGNGDAAGDQVEDYEIL